MSGLLKKSLSHLRELCDAKHLDYTGLTTKKQLVARLEASQNAEQGAEISSEDESEVEVGLDVASHSGNPPIDDPCDHDSPAIVELKLKFKVAQLQLETERLKAESNKHSTTSNKAEQVERHIASVLPKMAEDPLCFFF